MPDSTSPAQIAQFISSAEIPEDVRDAVAKAYADAGEPAVAVRSSATAEDLPEASFAGQQESFLNVRGIDAVLESLRACWASLWSERAVQYREMACIEHATVSMAVVVQSMADARAAGVAFTADPVTGNRDRMLINATTGLAEDLVAGQITPDSWPLEDGRVIEQTIAEKSYELVASPSGGVERTALANAGSASLTDAQVAQLAALALRIQSAFGGVPQDIEWVLTPHGFTVVQSRPVTSLSPQQLEWEPPTPGEQFIRRQVVENMPDPVTPLFEDVYLTHALDGATDDFLAAFGMEDFDLWQMVTRPMFVTINGYAYCRASYRFGLKQLPTMLRLYGPALKALPTMGNHWVQEGQPAYRRAIARFSDVDWASASSTAIRDAILELAQADARHWFGISIMVGIAKVTDGLLHLFATKVLPGSRSSGMYLKGFLSPTLEARQSLRRVAERASRSGLVDRVRDLPAPEGFALLEADPQVGPLLRTWLAHAGHQVYTLDFGAPTLGERPEAVVAAVLNAGAGTDTAAAEREASVAEAAASVGPLRRLLFRLIYGWASSAAPGREAALFRMGAAWPTGAFELGERLVAAGALEAPDDIYYLRLAELSAWADEPEGDFRDAVAARRRLHGLQSKVHPPPMVPVGAQFKVGDFNMSAFETQKRNDPSSSLLEGFAVSPGAVTATACVIAGPDDFHKMRDGAILVCATTTPAWTPLFAQAAGLVTDIGGILAHGSIVAREYGIPAVLGTGDITRRVRDGQMLRVDGTAGRVTLLD